MTHLICVTITMDLTVDGVEFLHLGSQVLQLGC
nr:MAG TPA: hypothetical protein [Caudoviricetes sp.]